MTKIEKILKQRGMTQADLMRSMTEKTGFMMGRDRISKIVKGKLTNYTLETASMIAETLGVTIDEIVELKKIRKKNFVDVHIPKKMGKRTKK
jgi:hypothetical protein